MCWGRRETECNQVVLCFVPGSSEVGYGSPQGPRVAAKMTRGRGGMQGEDRGGSRGEERSRERGDNSKEVDGNH